MNENMELFGIVSTYVFCFMLIFVTGFVVLWAIAEIFKANFEDSNSVYNKALLRLGMNTRKFLSEELESYTEEEKAVITRAIKELETYLDKNK